MRIFLFTLAVLGIQSLWAQKINNTASFKDIPSEKYFRFNYENDYFTATDRNYTQGYSFEFVNKIFDKNPINLIFFSPKNASIRNGLALEHIAYTPKNLSSHNVEVGDRPYAASAYLKSFSIAEDKKRSLRFTSSFNFGILGPAAIGYEIQSGIHAAIDGVEPSGWKYQIDHHIVINYELGVEKKLFDMGNWGDVRATGNAQIGTLFTNTSTGLNAKIGNNNSRNNLKWHIYGQALAKAIGFDATLQGGLFGDQSIYTIPSNSINRLVSQCNAGLVFSYKNLFLEYSRAWISQEFSTGTKAAWGEVHIGFRESIVK